MNQLLSDKHGAVQYIMWGAVSQALGREQRGQSMLDLLAERLTQKPVPGLVVDMLEGLRNLLQWIDRKLQRKLVLILAILLFGTSLAFLAMVVTLYQKQLVSEHARASMQVNRLLQASLENAMLKRDIDGLRGIVSKLGAQHGIAVVTILNPDLVARFSSDTNLLGKKFNTPAILKALSSRSQQTGSIQAEDGRQLLRSVNPVRNKPRCKQCHGAASVNPVNGLLIVDYDAAGIKQNALESALMLGGIGFLVVLASGGGIWMALHWLVITRLRRLHDVSGEYARGNLDIKSGLSGTDEITRLGESFDDMAGRLGKSLNNLNASKLFLQNVIDSIPDGVRVIDNDFNIIMANQAYCSQISQTMEEVVGDKCYRSSHARDEPCLETLVTCPVAELRKEPSTGIKARQQHFDADGSELFVEVSAARVQMTIDGVPSSYVIESIRDLAAQTRISHEQRLSEIGLLATGVAHEIHNPLTSIQFALKALQGETRKHNNIEYLEIAEAEIGKCLEVTDRLLMLSVPPGRELELVDMEKAIQEVVSLLSYQLEHANVVLRLELEPLIRVLASDSDMRMIVINLAQNAIHAMPDGGELTIGGRHSSGWIELIFGDTGEGIDGLNLDKIFLPFWTKRADASGGRGLGLSICKAIVDRSGGKMSIESTLNEGTAFTILLPDADMESSVR